MKHLLYLLCLCCLMSCNNWLDVRPETEQKDDEQFSTIDGFFDALVGTYMEMAKTDAYGQRLTITNIESLANLWYMPQSVLDAQRLEDWYLTAHDYSADDSRHAIAAMYAQLFHIIANANLIIKNVDEEGDVFWDVTMRNVVQGEAYAIRAYCQLDVLRLFGQLPQKATKQVQLPYSFTTSIYEMPAYYGFEDYVKLLKQDLAQAEKLLKDNDPLFGYTFSELTGANNEIADKHLLYRQFRLNYWAVKALEARTLLYIGETGEAYRVAKEMIDAKGPDGNPVREMTGAKDIADGYRLCPNECLFALSKHDVMTSTIGFLNGGVPDAVFFTTSDLGVSMNRLNLLFAGEQTASHNRYLQWWERNVRNEKGTSTWAVTKRYWWNDKAKDAMLNCQLVPMLRMSEVYLIGMETSADLTEVNTWYKKYMMEHEVGNSTDFASLDDARTWVRTEYCREFLTEGQSFYTYKRTGATTMIGIDREITEQNYILPLPETEYNPNNL